MSESKYTVFVSENGEPFSFLLSGQGRSKPGDLQSLIDAASNSSYEPVAWMPGHISWVKCYEDECYDSIAAGRTIELIDGKYVARGIPEQVAAVLTPDVPEESLHERLLRTNAIYSRIEPKRAALTWAKTTPFDPFKGYVVKSCTQDQPRSLGKFTSPDLSETTPQVKPEFGSAWLVR